MNYELAKKLKDAGFPQDNITMSREGKDISYVDSGKCTREDYSTLVSAEYTKKEDKCYLPTLEELIDACGMDFDNLERSRPTWTAHGGKTYLTLHKEGKTPSEAVANLYLALNKK